MGNGDSMQGGMPQLVGLQQVGQMLDISKRTVQRLIAAGHLAKPIKVGRSSKLATEDVQAFIEQQKAARRQERS